MGAFLDKPITDKHSGEGEGNGLRYGYSSMQGWRMSMEDAHSAVPIVPGLESCSFYGVYDGHCGNTIAKYSSENLLSEFLKHSDIVDILNSENNNKNFPEVDIISKAMKEVFVILDDYMRTIPPWKNGEDQSGTTAVCSFITPEHIVIANCGDSRAIFSRGNEVVLVTRDHKPYMDDERNRIERAGGSVMMQRVNGSLAVSRALGDYEYKGMENITSVEQQVSPEPEIFALKRENDKDEFLVIACDGIWDVMSNQEVLEYVNKELQIQENRAEICNSLIEECFQRGSRDNMSVVLVTFPACPTINEEAVLKDVEEKKRISAITEKIEQKVSNMYKENSMVTINQVLVATEAMLEVEDPDTKNLRIPKRRIVENKITSLREGDCTRRPPTMTFRSNEGYVFEGENTNCVDDDDDEPSPGVITASLARDTDENGVTNVDETNSDNNLT